MGDGETLRRAAEYFHPFPLAEDVFTNRVKEHIEYLLPVATIALSRFVPGSNQKLHVVIPIEPAAGWGYVGDRSAAYHNYLCRPNWIGYRVIDGKLELACDFRYFHKAFFKGHPPRDQHGQLEAKELGTYYEEIRAEFGSRRRYFLQNGFIRWSPQPYRITDPQSNSAPWFGNDEDSVLLPLMHLGGQSRETNWTSTDFPLALRPPAKDQELDDEMTSISMKTGIRVGIDYGLPVAVPKTEDGREFAFIGFVDLETYVGIDCGMLVFYDAREQIVLTTFDCT